MFGVDQYSQAELKQVVGVQFAVWSPEEIKRQSVCHVTSAISFVRGDPEKGGVQDPHLGTSDRDIRCLQCQHNSTDCPGHFGHIEFARPVFNVGYISIVLKVLRCVCVHCSKLLVDKTDPRMQEALRVRHPVARLRKIVKICETKSKCEKADDAKDDYGDVIQTGFDHGGCGQEQPKIRREPGTITFVQVYKGKGESAGDKSKPLMAEEVLRILKYIPDEHVEMMGFNPKHCRPEWMILTVFPVCPPPVRPSVLLDSVTRSDEDLTHLLKDIIKANNLIKQWEQTGVPLQQIQAGVEALQAKCACFLDNERNWAKKKASVKSGRPIKSIRERLKGKGGRVRQNLMGKRVDFSARSVITADPNLELDQVGVPQSMARTLTFPETVTPFNIDKMYELVRNGANTWPGAKFIIREDKQRVNLQYIKKRNDLHLEPGYVVERHINDGDVVLFNRQPTLHRMSMMGHRVKVLPYSTFRLNLSVTTPYNADFDGDEMNLHVPQTLLAKAELIHMMMVPKNIITAQANKPCMGIVQDSLLGCNRLTKRDTFLDRPLMMQCLMHVPNFERIPVPAILKAPGTGPLWTGKQLFSEIIPPVNKVGSSIEVPDEEVDAHNSVTDTTVLIKQGELITGICDKKSVGNGSGSLVHIIFNEFGAERTKWFLTNVQRVVNHWLVNISFSVGCGDTIADERVVLQINDVISKCKTDVKKVMKKAQEGTLECQPGKTIQETFEKEVNTALNQAREDAGKEAFKSLRRSNRFRVMVAAGSKGSHLNISQIAACVGQQNVDGKRIPFGFRRRTLPHFTKDDHGPESRGFVENCYLRGLTAQELFFHAMGGREGLSDTAVKTALTGYIQRKLIKAMEDVKVMYDGTVRDGMGRLVQFIYGEDGMDGTKLENQKFDIMRFSNKDMENRYKYDDPTNPHFGLGWMDPDIREDILKDPKQYDRLLEEFEQLRKDREFLRWDCFTDGEEFHAMPLNLDRLIDNAKTVYCIGPKNVSDLHPCEVIESLNKLQETLIVCRVNRERQETSTMLIKLFLRTKLASKRVLKEHRLDRESFAWLLGEIKSRFDAAQVNPGEMVGCIAGQSCGEPATQMTLNTFHFAGVSSKNVTLGVPRLRELISVAKKPKQQGLTVWLDEKASYDAELARQVQTHIEFTTLGHITKHVEIIYDPNPAETVVEADKQFVADIWDPVTHTDEQMAHLLNLKESMSPWLMRLELDKQSFWGKNMEMEEIETRIRNEFENLWVETNDDNAEHLILRLRFTMTKEEKAADVSLDSSQSNLVDFLRVVEAGVVENLHLRGIPRILKCTMTHEKITAYNAETGAAEKKKPLVLNTDGSNLLDVLACDHVNARRTYCNNVCEITEVLGIEAVRAELYKQIKFVYMVYGIGIGYRHYSILCDVMTNKGHLMAISRHGINRATTGPLMRSSFEETVEILFQAAAFGEYDPVLDVSSNIMLGKQARVGTGLFDVHLDEEMLEREHAVDQEAALALANASGADGGGSGAHHSLGMASPGSDLSVTSPRTVLPDDFIATPMGSEQATPFSPVSPMNTPFSPTSHNVRSTLPFSPMHDGLESGAGYITSPRTTSPSWTPGGALSSTPGLTSPAFSPVSPTYSPSSPTYSPSSPQITPNSPSYSPRSPGAASPNYSPTSPMYSAGLPVSPTYSPKGGPVGAASPTSSAHGMFSPVSPTYSPNDPSSTPASSHGSGTPGYSPASPAYSPATRSYSPTDPSMGSPVDDNVSLTDRSASNYSPASSTGGGGFSPASPAYSPASPAYSPASPQYSPASPQYSPASPQYSPASPQYSPASPQYSPASPQYSPASPQYSPASPQYSPASPQYSPASPQYSPASPQFGGKEAAAKGPRYSPASPQYSPASPKYSPASPQYSPSSPQFSPASPQYSPTSPHGIGATPSSTTPNQTSPNVHPQYSPASPQYSPTSPHFSPHGTSPNQTGPTSPQYSPTSPQYTPTGSGSRAGSAQPAVPHMAKPTYSPTSPQYSPTSPQYSPQSPRFSPISPQYTPTASRTPSSTGLSSPAYSPAGGAVPRTAFSPAYTPTSSTADPKKRKRDEDKNESVKDEDKPDIGKRPDDDKEPPATNA